MSTDRFGYPYSPLEDGEIDQGQYDRVREVRVRLLVRDARARSDAWARSGCPTNASRMPLEDLDFCWRARSPDSGS